jgi:hypothetical protein
VKTASGRLQPVRAQFRKFPPVPNVIAPFQAATFAMCLFSLLNAEDFDSARPLPGTAALITSS